MNCKLIAIITAMAAMSGCMNPKKPINSVVFSEEAMVFLEPGLRPEILLFPDYFFMEDFELTNHGNIPMSELVGAGFRTGLELKIAMRRFADALDSNGWTIEKSEIGKHSIRTLASTADEFVEIRAVQGEVTTEIYMLYRPKLIADTVKNY